MLLTDKRLLVTGVLNDASIAFSVRAPSAGRRRGDRAHVIRAGDEPHAAGRPPTSDGTGSDRARRHVGDRSRRARRTGRRPPRWCPARNRIRARVVPRWWVPDRAVGRRRRRTADLGVFVEGPRGCVPAAHGERRQHRRPRLRQQPRRVARLRLDGCRQGRARIDRALPRAATSAATASVSISSRPGPSARSPRRAFPDSSSSKKRGLSAHHSAGTSRTRHPSRARASRCSRTSSPRPPARSSTSMAATTRSAPSHPRKLRSIGAGHENRRRSSQRIKKP